MIHRITKTNYFIGASLLAVLLASGTMINNTHAESSSTNASVTVANTISLTLTGGDLVINNLTPGSASDSNVITASVTSNSPYGINLSATTGTVGGTTSLVNTADSNSTFANLDSNKASLANFSDNTWGYSYSENGSSWISGDYGAGATAGYNGLPLDGNDNGDSGVVLFNSDSYLGSKSMQFKIGAKSATTQAAGTYTNTVNFYAVTNPEPLPYMQDMTSTTLNQLLSNVEDTTTLYDKRDGQAYTIAKLADNKYWMVDNLNIAGGTELSSTDTDFDANYTLPTTNGWTTNNGKLVLPASATKNDANNNLTDNTQFSTDNYAYVFNSGNKENCGASGQNTPCYSYYSWDASTLGSGRSISTDNTDAQYSICPKNWKLPTSRTTSATNWQTESNFYALAHQYGLDSTVMTYENDDGFYTQAGPNTIPSFLLAGRYYRGSFDVGGSVGYYWSSTSYSSAMSARYLNLYSSGVGSADGISRGYGYSVRCLFSGQ